MKNAHLPLLLALVAPALSALARSQEPKTLALAYKDGESVTAQVLGLEGDAVRLKVLVLGGQMQVKRKLGDFTTESAFAIELEAKKPTGFDAHFAMAKRAAELRLVPQAGSQARAAVESVKDAAEAAQKRTEVRTWAADALEEFLREAIAAGQLRESQHYLKLLSTRLSDMRSEEQLDALANLVQALDTKAQEQRQAARQVKLDAKVRAEIDRRLQPITRQIEAGDKKQREAVRKSRSTVESSNLCEKAIDAYKAAWKDLQALVAKYPDDADLAQSAASLGKHLHDHAISAALHAANMLTVQSDYKGAMDWANRILAYEPDNAEAKEMVRTIQIAQAAASGEWAWGWRAAGGGVPVPDPRKN